MNVARAVGIETEYGIVAHSSPPAGAEWDGGARGGSQMDPIEACRILLNQFGGLGLVAVPHVDAQCHVPADGDAAGDAGAWLTSGPGEVAFYEAQDWMLANGSRLYIDHAHPEYCTPECPSARAAVAADKAGEVILERCREAVAANGAAPPGQKLSLYKNNSDHKGNSYGCHENYLLSRSLYEDLLYRRPQLVASQLLPFLVTRIIFCGAGKAGSEHGRPPAGFQLSQRADFFEVLAGVQTTHRRPLFNTRDEAHADPSHYRRLHVIVGDANMAEVSTYLKVGTMLILFRMMEDGFLKEDLTLADPLLEFRSVSRDIDFRGRLTLLNGEELSAVEIQRRYLAAARRYLRKAGASEEERDLIARWAEALGAIEKDWQQLASKLDWAIKRKLLERYLSAKGTTWAEVRRWEASIGMILGAEARLAGESRLGREKVYASLRKVGLSPDDYDLQREVYFGLRRLDLQYHDVRRDPPDEETGLFYRLQNRGVIQRVTTDEEIDALVENPPEGTRAWFRGNLLRRFSRAVAWADWSCVRLSDYVPPGGPGLVLSIATPASDYAASAEAIWRALEVQRGADAAGLLEIPAEGNVEHDNDPDEKETRAKPGQKNKAGRGGAAKKGARPAKAGRSGATGQRHRRPRD